jgi:hypothetical protein
MKRIESHVDNREEVERTTAACVLRRVKDRMQVVVGDTMELAADDEVGRA